MTGAQRGRLHEIAADLILENDKGRLDITPATMDYLQKWIQAILDNDDGLTAYWMINEWHKAWGDDGKFHGQDFLSKVMSKAILIDV